jgi:hypothetical protein
LRILEFKSTWLSSLKNGVLLFYLEFRLDAGLHARRARKNGRRVIKKAVRIRL